MIRGVNPAARTPLWMRERLRRAGLRPISPVVDVTNYVMLELGQPMHAYDLREIAHRRARRARRRALKLLDGREVELAADTLVIADATGPVGLAGVMGGDHCGIARTRPTSCSRAPSSRRMPSPARPPLRARHRRVAALRAWRRSALQERAIERATQLLLAFAGGRPGPTVLTQDEAHLPKRPGVTLRPERVASLLGVQIPRNEIEDILRRLGMQVAGAGDILGVIPPSRRFDIAIEEDLIEEIARMYGFDRIPRATRACRSAHSR